MLFFIFMMLILIYELWRNKEKIQIIMQNNSELFHRNDYSFAVYLLYVSTIYQKVFFLYFVRGQGVIFEYFLFYKSTDNVTSLNASFLYAFILLNCSFHVSIWSFRHVLQTQNIIFGPFAAFHNFEQFLQLWRFLNIFYKNYNHSFKVC